MPSDDENVAKEEEEPKLATRAFLKLHSRKIWIAIIVLLVGIMVIGLAAGLTSNRCTPSNDTTAVEDAASMPTTEAPTSMPTPSTELEALIKSRSPSTSFDNVTSPQSLALKWIADNDHYSSELSMLEDNDDRLIQRFALAVFWYSTGGPTTWGPGGWLESTDECSWPQTFDCTTDGLVQFLFLDAKSLSGTMPIELGLLTALARLSMFSNSLAGTLPTELGKLTRLTFLAVRQNQLTGSIPSELGQLTSLTGLYLSSNNNLSGMIPNSLCDAGSAATFIGIGCTAVACSCCAAGG